MIRRASDAREGHMSEAEGRGAAWTEERGTSDEGRRRLQAPRRRAGRQREPRGRGATWTEEQHMSEATGRGGGGRRGERRGRGAAGREEQHMSEPKGRGVAWTEERGTSDEGRRRLKAPRRRAGDTVSTCPELMRGAACRRYSPSSSRLMA